MEEDLIIYRGITFSNPFVSSSVNSTTRVETPNNLTGKTVYFEMLKGFPAAVLIGSAGPASTLGSTVTVTSNTAGAFTVKLTVAETLTAKTGRYHFACYTLDGAGDRFYLGGGDIDIRER